MELDFLRSVSILRDLTAPELEGFAKLFASRQVSGGEKILEEGQPVTTFSIVCEGIVHVRRLAQKREILLGRLGVGAFFGEINLFDPGVATASIYAMKPVKLAVVDYDSLLAFLSSNPVTGYKIVCGMMGEMARRLRQTSSRLVNTVYWSNSGGAAGGITRVS